MGAKEWDRHRALDPWLALCFSPLDTSQTQTEYLQLQSTLSCIWAAVCEEADIRQPIRPARDQSLP